jgi:type II secretory pathway pseudopilin PulG
MTDTTAAPAGSEGETAPLATPVTPADPSTTYHSPSSAGRALAEMRWRRAKEAEAAPEEAAAEPEAPVSPEGESADQPPADPGETDQPQAEPEPEAPPIDPPRSWTKEAKERWQSLPRETQEYLAQREQEREREFRRSQNEAAEARKAIEAERSQVEQARSQYETALPALLQTLQVQQQGEFADIKTMADVEKMAREDWPRYVVWDAQQKKIAAVQQEVKASQDRQVQETQQHWSKFAQEQDSLLLERAPELADKTQAAKIADAALTYLKDLGFTDNELAANWNGQDKISLRDHRLQLLIRDGVRYREAQSKVSVKAAKPVPQVQRPGPAPARGAAEAEKVQALTEKLSQSGSLKDAQALLVAKRAARR